MGEAKEKKGRGMEGEEESEEGRRGEWEEGEKEEGGKEEGEVGWGGEEESHFFSNTLTLFFHYGKSEPKVKMFKTNS